MDDTTAQFKRQLPRNAFFQVLSFIARVGIGLWLVPYLVHHLGRAAYGLIPIAGIMTQYVSIISQSVSSAVSRFLTVALQRGDTEEANRIFNTALHSYLALALLQIPVFGVIIWQANHIFTIPHELYVDAILLLMCSATAFLVNLVTSVFAVPIYANNRLDISRGINVVRQIARLMGIVGLFLILHPALRYVGYVDLTLSVAECLATIGIGRWLAPSLRLDRHAFDWKKVRQLTTMGGWLVINYIGFLLFLRVDIWVCNRFIGAEAAGDYAAMLPWSNLIRQGGQLMAGVISPMIVIYYARSEMEQLIRLNGLSVRIFALVLAIPVSVLCAFSKPLLELWLGESFTHLAPLMTIMVAHLVVNVGVLPLFSIQTALNKVKWPALVTVVMGVLNLALTISFARYLHWGVLGVAVASAIVLTLKNALFTPIYAALILGQPWHHFLRSYVLGLLFFAGLTTLGITLDRTVHPRSWSQLLGIAMVVGAVGAAVAWAVLPRQDRRQVINLLPERLRIVLARFIAA
ncbi:MAG: oligosaccharide flippase family protein [Phycisphaerales bacterium]|nr:MAG: oligosaccharide flippase family protein [Phycisphaerales bacterium]